VDDRFGRGCSARRRFRLYRARRALVDRRIPPTRELTVAAVRWESPVETAKGAVSLGRGTEIDRRWRTPDCGNTWSQLATDTRLAARARFRELVNPFNVGARSCVWELPDSAETPPNVHIRIEYECTAKMRFFSRRLVVRCLVKVAPDGG
jgi:hypothetical protein